MRYDTTRFDTLLEDRAPRDPLREYCEVNYPAAPDLPVGTERFATAEWDAIQAIRTLGLTLVDTQLEPHDNSNGQSLRDKIWLKPDTNLPIKVAVHEIAHSVHEHSELRAMGGNAFVAFVFHDLLVAVCEAEADATAMLVCDALGLDDDVEACRHYIKGYIGDMPIPVHIREKIKRAAVKILEAGLTPTAALKEAA